MPTQTDAQRSAAFSAAGLNPSQQASVIAGVPDATIANSSVRRYTGPTNPDGSPYAPTPTPGAAGSGSAYDTFAAGQQAPGGIFDTTPPDEAAIRAAAQQRVQAQVDTIKNTYAGILAQTAKDNVGRAGATRALDARSGTLGSDFGNADKAKTDANNQAIIDAQSAERDQKINELFQAADDRATAQIENDKNRAMKSSEDYLSFLKQNADQARTDIKSMSASGLTIDQLPQDQYNNLLKQTGYSPQQLQAEFVLNKPQDKILTSFTQGNKYYVISQDPITGARKTDTIDLGFTVPQDYSTTKLDDGSLVFSPKAFDPSKPIKDQILTYGAPSASYKLDQQQKVATLTHTQLENQKLLTDSKADASTTQDLKDAADALAQGANADAVRQRFLDTHPTQGQLFLQYTKQAY